MTQFFFSIFLSLVAAGLLCCSSPPSISSVALGLLLFTFGVMRIFFLCRSPSFITRFALPILLSILSVYPSPLLQLLLMFDSSPLSRNSLARFPCSKNAIDHCAHAQGQQILASLAKQPNILQQHSKTIED